MNDASLAVTVAVTALLVVGALLERLSRKVLALGFGLLFINEVVYGPMIRAAAPYVVTMRYPDDIEACVSEEMRTQPVAGAEEETVASGTHPKSVSFTIQCREEHRSYKLYKSGWTGVVRSLWR